MSDGNVEKAILAAMGDPRSGLIERVTRHNQILLHNYRSEVPRSCECQLMGCDKTFDITLVPNQVLYPKYCEAHRSEFRRREFLRRIAGQPAVYRLESFRIVADPVSLPPLPG
jgi:hypothetical protein